MAPSPRGNSPSAAAIFTAHAEVKDYMHRESKDYMLPPAVSEDEGGDETKALASSEAPTPRKRMPTALQAAALVSVPLFWGTFTPSMKLLLDHHHAPPVVFTNFLSHVAGVIALGLLWLAEAVPRGRCFPDAESGLRAAADDEPPSRQRMLLASCELGFYLFFGQLTQLLGLSGTTATINAILVQSSVVLVPVIEEARSGLPASGRLRRLLPSQLALVGIATITVMPSLIERANGSSGGSSSITSGRLLAAAAAEDEQTTFGILCSLASAGFYALHTLRLSEYGDVDATVQATGQVAANAVLDFLALPIAAYVGGPGGNALRWLYHASAHDRPALRKLLAAAAWNGVFIVGATTWAMSYAQRSFRASTAALAYAMEPLFAAVFAAAVLDESLGLVQLGGGVLIVAANVLVGMRAIED